MGLGHGPGPWARALGPARALGSAQPGEDAPTPLTPIPARAGAPGGPGPGPEGPEGPWAQALGPQGPGHFPDLAFFC